MNNTCGTCGGFVGNFTYGGTGAKICNCPSRPATNYAPSPTSFTHSVPLPHEPAITMTTPIEAMKEKITSVRYAQWNGSLPYEPSKYTDLDPDKLAAELVRLEEKFLQTYPIDKAWRNGYLAALKDVEELIRNEGGFLEKPEVMQMVSSLRDKQK